MKASTREACRTLWIPAVVVLALSHLWAADPPFAALPPPPPMGDAPDEPPATHTPPTPVATTPEALPPPSVPARPPVSVPAPQQHGPAVPAPAYRVGTQPTAPAARASVGRASRLVLASRKVLPGQLVRVTIENPPTETNAWIGFYPEQADHRDYLKYNFTRGLNNGVYEDVLAPDMPGRYNFRLFLDESFVPVAVSDTLEIAR